MTLRNKLLMAVTTFVATAAMVKKAETLLAEHDAKKRRESEEDQAIWDPNPEEPDRRLASC